MRPQRLHWIVAGRKSAGGGKLGGSNTKPMPIEATTSAWPFVGTLASWPQSQVNSASPSGIGNGTRTRHVLTNPNLHVRQGVSSHLPMASRSRYACSFVRCPPGAVLSTIWPVHAHSLAANTAARQFAEPPMSYSGFRRSHRLTSFPETAARSKPSSAPVACGHRVPDEKESALMLGLMEGEHEFALRGFAHGSASSVMNSCCSTSVPMDARFFTACRE